MSVSQKLEERINANKEVLAALPKNNKKNRKIYVEKVNALHEEFCKYKEQLKKEMEERYNTATQVSKDAELNNLQKTLEGMEQNLSLLNSISTSYEKMGLDKELQTLGRYYKQNLDIVNEIILRCIGKFKEVGVPISLEDFRYSRYVKEYLKVVFKQINGGEQLPKKIKEKFEEVYWKCPDIITHIELNFRYLYIKYEKEIDKYYEKQKKQILGNKREQDVLNEYKELKKEYIEKSKQDKYSIVTNFIEGKIRPEDYLKTKMSGTYEKFITSQRLDDMDEAKLDEISVNMGKLQNSVHEYKNYLKFKFIIEDIRKIYMEKEIHQKAYEQIKKEIVLMEDKIVKLEKKIQGGGFFKKPDEKSETEQNSLLLSLKQLYRDLDKNKMYDKIHLRLKDSSTIYGMLLFAGSFYDYVYRYMRDVVVDIEEEEIDKTIQELRDFINWPFCILLNNIKILERKDMLLIIRDRYQLLGINIARGALGEGNLDQLEKEIEKMQLYYYITKNNINIEELGTAMEFKKILQK